VLELDSGLIDAVRSKRAVIFLGAGASLGAKKGSANIPDSKGLAKLLCDEFLSPEYEDANFATVYDFSCSARSTREVQDFLHRLLFGFEPAAHHLIIPKLVWAGLATTNYDLLIEKAYESNQHAKQVLIPNTRDGDGANDKIGPDTVLYVKLHGCITRYQEIDPPLVASTEQIINHKTGRSGQFAQFLEWARTKTIIFAGYALADYNLRTLIEEIRKEGDGHPRHYIVRPGILKTEADYWAERRIKTISARFDEFLQTIDRKITESSRVLALAPVAVMHTTFTRFIARADTTETDRLKTYLATRCEHVSASAVIEETDPKRFYRGADLGWFPLTHDLDVKRRVSQDVLQEQILSTAVIRGPRLCLLKGHAGSGKTIVSKRIAWDAATKHDKLVMRITNGDDIDVELFEEMFGLINQPLFLFIDDITDGHAKVDALLNAATKRGWQLVVIGSARVNEWNVRCEDLQEHLSEEYDVGYLSVTEIHQLLDLLDKAGALGHLATLPNREQQAEKLKEVYGRQLLVALHEATENASFRTIIEDEYKSVVPLDAQLLYRDICALNRFGPPVRAGLISRLHGIGFNDFRERFFKPLERVVELFNDPRTQDRAYRSRHPFIAETVYMAALPSVAQKHEHLLRIIGKLNPSYSYDNEVLFHLLRASTLANVFAERGMGAAIYEEAISSFGDLAVIYHQWGIYEMRLAGDVGALNRAERFLTLASEKEPRNAAIKHSMAELSFKRSTIANDLEERESWRRRAEEQASSLAKSGKSSFPFHTLAKVGTSRVRDAIENLKVNESELAEEHLGNAVREAEDALRQGLQRFPADDRLLTEEANLSDALHNEQRALTALRRAFDKNSRSELVALRLARIYRANHDFDEASAVLRSTLTVNPGSQRLHFDLARTLLETSSAVANANAEAIAYHLNSSYSRGDRKYEARFWHARQLCIVGRGSDGLKLFAELKGARVTFQQKRAVRGIIRNDDETHKKFYGLLYAKNASFGFIRSDSDGLEVFVSKTNFADWDYVSQGERVSYEMGFSLEGPVALNVEAR
jgi:cold shock CspA family protein